jgi:hypothetical protein
MGGSRPYSTILVRPGPLRPNSSAARFVEQRHLYMVCSGWQYVLFDTRKGIWHGPDEPCFGHCHGSAFVIGPNPSVPALSDLRKGKPVTQQSLLRIAQAVEELRQVADPIAREMEDWRQVAVRLCDKVGGRNRLATIPGVSAPYLGRMLKAEKPMTAEMVERLAAVMKNADA